MSVDEQLQRIFKQIERDPYNPTPYFQAANMLQRLGKDLIFYSVVSYEGAPTHALNSTLFCDQQSAAAWAVDTFEGEIRSTAESVVAHQDFDIEEEAYFEYATAVLEGLDSKSYLAVIENYQSMVEELDSSGLNERHDYIDIEVRIVIQKNTVK